jgi:hypothetical protein
MRLEGIMPGADFRREGRFRLVKAEQSKAAYVHDRLLIFRDQSAR